MGRGPTAADTSDLKPSALFLLPLRSALFLRRLCRLLLRFLLPVHTLAHGSPPHDGEQFLVRATIRQSQDSVWTGLAMIEEVAVEPCEVRLSRRPDRRESGAR